VFGYSQTSYLKYSTTKAALLRGSLAAGIQTAFENKEILIVFIPTPNYTQL